MTNLLKWKYHNQEEALALDPFLPDVRRTVTLQPRIEKFHIRAICYGFCIIM